VDEHPHIRKKRCGDIREGGGCSIVWRFDRDIMML